MKLLIEYLENYDPLWGPLEYKHPDDSGFDLRAAIKEPITLKPGQITTVPNGVKMQLESDSSCYEIQTRPRSGLAAKYGISIVNAPGTIDFGYRGELKTILVNLGPDDFVINPGDRIAQAVVTPIIRPEIITGVVTNETERGADGFGSTGKA